MLEKLCKIEETPVEDVEFINYEDNITFQEINYEVAKQMEKDATPEIIETLQDLRQKQVRNSSSEKVLDDSGWIEKKSKKDKVDKVAKDIWKLWTKECEQAPRCGIILLSLEKLDAPEVLLIMYYKNNDPHYGYPKGKIEIGETKWQCALRETSEELGYDMEFRENDINDEEAILKNVGNPFDNSTIEHYYFIVPGVPKDIHFKLNQTEVNAIEWCDIYKLPCCQDCQVTQLMTRADEKIPNYFMVICYDKLKRTSLVQ
ncbi:unnamed protein product [Adineta steineri]|nr:unnamed protein product [Adineta steineri]CAF1493049.1 unnamed protein product [Adineta steineri]